MEIINNTDQDARVRVSGGAGGIDDPDSAVAWEDPSKWHHLPPKGSLAPQPPFPIPWKVHVVINGCRITKEVRSERGVVTLAPDGQTFKASLD